MKKFVLIFMFCFLFSESQYPNQSEINEIITKSMELVWKKAMEARNNVREATPHIREEYLENLSSSAPSTNFITHADLSDELTQANNTSASVFVSMDNQSSWVENSNVAPLGSNGFENTWSATTITSGGNNVDWYLQGSIDSGSLDLDFGQLTISQSPYNENNQWPPNNNLYATVAEDSNADTGSGQDIVGIRASYSNDKLYAAMDLEGACCDDGSLFGPWYLYSIAIVNPDAENPVAYAYAYGNGGFGQLYPAIYKIDGDLTTGQVNGFEVLSENFNYSTAGNSFQASSYLDIIVNDSDWGTWPNSLNGVVLVGANVSAGIDIVTGGTPEILDTTDPAVLVMTTQSQNGNTAPVLSDFIYEDGFVSILYTDADDNLATSHELLIDDMVFTMVPNAHTYDEGVIFSANIGEVGGLAELYFSDGSTDVTLQEDLGNGGGCQLLGDANLDTLINVLDIVSTTNIILNNGEYNPCSDVNSDSQINVLDIVALVNLILGNRD